MHDNHKKLIDALSSQDSPVTAHALSRLTGVSVRSVKNYVTSINDAQGKRVILATRQGYQLAPGFSPPQSKKAAAVPQSHLERAYYLIKKVLLEHGELNVFDLSEELCVSYSTFKAGLAKMNQTFERFDVRFVSRGNELTLVGSEKNKRALASHVIFEETNGRLLDARTLEKSFPAKNVEKMGEIIRSLFSRHEYYLNDFAFMNVLLHSLILIDRVQHGKHVEKQLLHFDRSGDAFLTDELSAAMEAGFGLALSDNERAEIAVLIRTNVNQGLPSGAEEIAAVVGEPIVKQCGMLAKAVANAYGIELDNDYFMPAFAVHMKGLLERMAQGRVNRNPMLESLKRDCPMIYDIAVYMSLALGADAGRSLEEDEIAFIALHVGAEVERQRLDTGKIRCALLCPGYRGIEERIYRQLQAEYAMDCEFVGIASTAEALDGLPFDLLFTTVPVEQGAWLGTQTIAPFGLREKRPDILGEIERVRTEKRKVILRDNFSRFFLPQLFYADPPFGNRDELLAAVCADMVRYGCVTPDFHRQVLEREAASPTAFGRIAMPHSIHMDAIKTCIAVVISKSGIAWGEGKLVNIVLLTAINRVEKRYFSDIYEALLSLFDDAANFEYLCRVRDFSELQAVLTAR